MRHELHFLYRNSLTESNATMSPSRLLAVRQSQKRHKRRPHSPQSALSHHNKKFFKSVNILSANFPQNTSARSTDVFKHNKSTMKFSMSTIILAALAVTNVAALPVAGQDQNNKVNDIVERAPDAPEQAKTEQDDHVKVRRQFPLWVPPNACPTFPHC
ncbi:unnamed protein product [Zymoseptoria tritici ST99CH_3D1]|nr:unnamed protein product [Zymoseptoria tritici ST99CH_3D1]